MSGTSRFARGSRRAAPKARPEQPDQQRFGMAQDKGEIQPDAPDASVSPRAGLAPQFAMAIVAVMIIGSPIAAIFNLLQRQPSLPVAAAGTGTLLLLTALQLSHLAWRGHIQRQRFGPAAFLAEIVLVYSPFLWVDNGWVGAPYFLAASALLVLPRRLAWPVFGLVSVSIPIIHRSLGASLYDATYYLVSTPALGLAVFGLTRLAGLVKELYETRAELARLAVTQERLRFARDLHDLLGYSLSAITLKSELVYRLADRHTARAKQELESVLVLSRQALADVRAVSSAYREMSLGAECTSARSILSAADIEVEIDVVTDEMGGPVNTVLATVLREGVTNLLRHSKAQHCEIRAVVLDGTARLSIVNDGVLPPLSEGLGRRGTGLENLAQRVQVLGGGLEAGLTEEGRFHLEAWVPLELSDTEPEPTDGGAGKDGGLPGGDSSTECDADHTAA